MGANSAAKAAAAARPGVDTLGFLDTAAVPDLPPADLVDAVIASERLLAHVHAVQARLLAELGLPGRSGDITKLVDALVGKAGQGRGDDGEIDQVKVEQVTAETAVRAAAAQVAAVLDWSPTTAKIRIGQAQRMLTALPATLAALHTGRVDIGRARMICDRTAVLHPADCAAVEARVLPLVKGRSKAKLETIVDREVISVDPEAAENRRIKANADREVVHRPDKDGMGIITALLPAEAAVLLFTLVDLIAEANKGLDERTVDQRRADALTDIADELLTHGYVDLDQLIAVAHRRTPTLDTPTEPGNPTTPTADNPTHTAPGAADPAGDNTPAESGDTATGTGDAADTTDLGQAQPQDPEEPDDVAAAA